MCRQYHVIFIVHITCIQYHVIFIVHITCIQYHVIFIVHITCREIATNLVKKLVSVMESVENLPLYLYESPGALYSLQILTKR